IDISDVEPSRLYILLCCILYWTDNISPDSSIRTNIIHLLKNNKNIDPSAMGFPANWKEEPLWKD
ncbi:MAG: Abi family protein, partial [Bacteroidales bacterium]|nr:Abi family protein [Bacteroidales bacterium]